MRKAFEAKPMLRITTELALKVAAVITSPGEPAELPAMGLDGVRVVPEIVKVVPAVTLDAVELSIRYIPFTRPVADETVIVVAALENTELNVETNGVTEILET